MKKTVSVIICAILILFVSGCKSDGQSASHDVDIENFANIGIIPESELKIGDKVPEIKETDEDYFVSADGKNSYFSNGMFNYYYDADQKDPEINKIVSFLESFGFDNGTISIEITDALDSAEIKYKEREPEKDELSFLPKSDNRSVIECRSLKHKLTFVFEDNALCATVLE